MEDKNKYYIRLDERGRIIQTFSDLFFKPTDDDILVGEGKFSQFVVGEDVLSEDLSSFANIENGLQLFNEKGILALKYEKGLICKLRDEELEIPSLPKEEPSGIELLKEENLLLMARVTEFYEKNLTMKKMIEELKEQKLDIVVAITNMCESKL